MTCVVCHYEYTPDSFDETPAFYHLPGEFDILNSPSNEKITVSLYVCPKCGNVSSQKV